MIYACPRLKTRSRSPPPTADLSYQTQGCLADLGVPWSPAENQDGNRQIFLKQYVSGMGGRALFDAPCIFCCWVHYAFLIFFSSPCFFSLPLCTIYRTSAPSPLTLFGLLRSIKQRFLCNNLFFGHFFAGLNFRTVELLPWQQKFLLGFMCIRFPTW